MFLSTNFVGMRRPTESTNLGPCGSQNVGHQQGSRQELELDPYIICYKCGDWFSWGSPNKWSRGCLFSAAQSPGWASKGENVPSPGGELHAPGWCGTQVEGGLPFHSSEEGEGTMGEEFVSVELGGQEGGGQPWGNKVNKNKYKNKSD